MVRIYVARGLTTLFHDSYVVFVWHKTTQPRFPTGRVGALVTLIATELLAVAALHRLGRLPWLGVDWRHLPASLTSSGAEDVLAASLRLVALVCAYWLLLSTVLYVAARLTHLPSAVRAVEWATLPAMRRLADRALAVAIVSSTVTGGAGAAWASAATLAEAPLIVLGVEEFTPPGVQPPPAPTLEVPCPQSIDAQSSFDLPPAVAPPSDVATPPVLEPPAEVIPPRAQRSHERPDRARAGYTAPTETTIVKEEVHAVVRGENLWEIAASTLRRSHGHALTDREIAPYWRSIIDANRHRLRSGNPNLIFPGEQVVLPPPERKPARPAGP